MFAAARTCGTRSLFARGAVFANRRIGSCSRTPLAAPAGGSASPAMPRNRLFTGSEFVGVRSLPLDPVADQPLDRIDIFLVVARNERQRCAAAPGAAGAADAMHVIFGM